MAARGGLFIASSLRYVLLDQPAQDGAPIASLGARLVHERLPGLGGQRPWNRDGEDNPVWCRHVCDLEDGQPAPRTRAQDGCEWFKGNGATVDDGGVIRGHLRLLWWRLKSR